MGTAARLGTTVIQRSILVIILPLLLLLNACGISPNPPPPPDAAPRSESRLPPRPAELSLEQVNPCTLLNDQQRQRLGVDPGKFSYDQTDTHYAVCQWSSSSSFTLINRYLARLRVRDGAEDALYSKTGSQVVQVGGFTAVQTSASGLDPNKHCILLIDVAAGQSLWAQYYAQGEFPGLTHAQSCQFARTAAEDMMTNLRAASAH
jgi:uncharacterized protein DUF3558